MNNTTPEKELLIALETQISIPAYAILIVVIIILFLVCVIYCQCCWPTPPTPQPQPLSLPLLPPERTQTILRSERKPRFIVQAESGATRGIGATI